MATYKLPFSTLVKSDNK